MIPNVRRFSGIVALLLVYFSAIVSLYDALNVIALYAAIPVAFFLSFSVGNSLKDNKYLILIICLFLWIGFTYLFAKYVEPANAQMRLVLGVGLVCVIIANLSKDRKMLPYLYGVYVAFFISLSIYARNHILTAAFDISNSRLSDEKLNANMMAYFLFYTTVSVYFLGEIVKNVTLAKVFRWLLFLIIPLSFYVAILTASRQVLVIQIPLLVLLLVMRYGMNWRRAIVLLVVVVIAGGYAYDKWGKDIYDHSYLKYRSETKLKDDPRARLIRVALEIGSEHPVVGVGPGNFRYYHKTREFSHNTYLELFANHGILAVVIYLSMLIMYMRRQWKRYRRYGDRNYLTFFVIGSIFMFDNFFYVFHLNLWLMSFFVLLSAHSEIYYRNKSKVTCSSITSSSLSIS